MRLSQDPTIDTVAKLGAVSVAMFAFVFVVMVPLYNVLCDALGINGKTSSEAYISVVSEVDETRSIKVQFIATNNDGMPAQDLAEANPRHVRKTISIVGERIHYELNGISCIGIEEVKTPMGLKLPIDALAQ